MSEPEQDEEKKELEFNVDDYFQQSSFQLDEAERLKFGRQILLGLALICIAVFTAYAIYPENQALSNIFELIKIGALPLVTLIIGFYFPNSNNSS
jgi:hypothetical protein